MTKKGWLCSVATFISVITGYRFVWDDNADKAFYIGLMIYLPCVAAAQFHPIITKYDRLACRLFVYGVINYSCDWVFGDPYKPGANEYIFLLLAIIYERILIFQEKNEIPTFWATVKYLLRLKREKPRRNETSK